MLELGMQNYNQKYWTRMSEYYISMSGKKFPTYLSCARFLENSRAPERNSENKSSPIFAHSRLVLTRKCMFQHGFKIETGSKTATVTIVKMKSG